MKYFLEIKRDLKIDLFIRTNHRSLKVALKISEFKF